MPFYENLLEIIGELSYVIKTTSLAIYFPGAKKRKRSCHTESGDIFKTLENFKNLRLDISYVGKFHKPTYCRLK